MVLGGTAVAACVLSGKHRWARISWQARGRRAPEPSPFRPALNRERPLPPFLVLTSTIRCPTPQSPIA